MRVLVDVVNIMFWPVPRVGEQTATRPFPEGVTVTGSHWHHHCDFSQAAFVHQKHPGLH